MAPHGAATRSVAAACTMALGLVVLAAAVWLLLSASPVSRAAARVAALVPLGLLLPVVLVQARGGPAPLSRPEHVATAVLAALGAATVVVLPRSPGAAWVGVPIGLLLLGVGRLASSRPVPPHPLARVALWLAPGLFAPLALLASLRASIVASPVASGAPERSDACVAHQRAVEAGEGAAACDRGEREGCFLQSLGAGGQEARRAASDRACELGHRDACMDLVRRTGVASLVGSHEGVDPRRAEEVAGRGCAAGQPLACDLEDSLREARRLAVAAATDCARGDQDACALRAKCLDRGWGVAVAREQARALYESACTAGSGRACAGLALRSRPQGADAPRSHRLLLERGCELGSPDACAELGSSALARGDRAEAERLLVPACEAHVLSACNTLFDDAYLASDPRADRYHALFCACPGAQCDDVTPRAPRFEDTP